MRNHRSRQRVQISFDRPERSPCLRHIKDPKSPQYAEALAIIEAGRKRLAERPRADMDGFVACETDLGRDRAYAARQAGESRNLEASREDRKAYDPGCGPPARNAP